LTTDFFHGSVHLTSVIVLSCWRYLR